jgi:hypothetical protein
VIYDCALRDNLLNEEKKVIENVIPNLVAYHSVLTIKSILEVKQFERKKEEEKAEREGRKVTFAPLDGSLLEEEKKGQ